VPRYQLFLVDALLRRQQIDEFVHLGLQEGPAALQVAQQAVALVLGDDANATDARIHAVREREIDDAELAAEIDRRLGARVGQVLQAAATAAGQHQGHGAPRQVQALGHIDGLHDRSCVGCRNKITSPSRFAPLRSGGSAGFSTGEST